MEMPKNDAGEAGQRLEWSPAPNRRPHLAPLRSAKKTGPEFAKYLAPACEIALDRGIWAVINSRPVAYWGHESPPAFLSQLAAASQFSWPAQRANL